jgi:hypothetical protein
MLALCKPPQKLEYYSIRDLPKLDSGDHECRWEDEQDDLRNLMEARRWRRQRYPRSLRGLESF